VSIFDAKYLGNCGRWGLFTIGNLYESGQAESIGDVTDDATWPDDVTARNSSRLAGVPAPVRTHKYDESPRCHALHSAIASFLMWENRKRRSSLSGGQRELRPTGDVWKQCSRAHRQSSISGTTETSSISLRKCI